MSDDWGPWIEHDGKGCPCRGMWVQRIYNRPAFDDASGKWIGGKEGLVVCGGKSWTWEIKIRVIRYRIRKPHALQQLRDMIENLPAPAREREGV